MNNEIRERYLKLALVDFGNRLLADLSTWPCVAFGLGLAWWPGQLLFADDQRCLCGPRHFSNCRCKESDQNRSLISFTIWSSVVHAAIMAVQALYDGREHGHLVADVPALLLVAGVLGFLSPTNKVASGAAG